VQPVVVAATQWRVTPGFRLTMSHKQLRAQGCGGHRGEAIFFEGAAGGIPLAANTTKIALFAPKGDGGRVQSLAISAACEGNSLLSGSMENQSNFFSPINEFCAL
jgi:hypothetical protein